MSPRTYQSPLRAAQMDALRDRIAAAAAELHAEKGALQTSFKEIAARADVAVPTVYKHFPDLEALIPACTGHVARRAPSLSVAELEAIPDLEGRVKRLVAAQFELHAYLEPWLRWREAEHIPALKKVLAQQQAHARDLLHAALAPARSGKVPEPLGAAAEVLLSFEAWQLLRARLSPAKALAAVRQALLTLAAPPRGEHP